MYSMLLFTSIIVVCIEQSTLFKFTLCERNTLSLNKKNLSYLQKHKYGRATKLIQHKMKKKEEKIQQAEEEAARTETLLTGEMPLLFLI